MLRAAERRLHLLEHPEPRIGRQGGAASRGRAAQGPGGGSLDFIRCFNDGESVVIEAQADGETADGVRYNSPAVFIFETHDGLITSLHEYSDTRLAALVFGPADS